MIKSLIVVCILFVACTSATEVKSCGNGVPLPLNVEISGCNDLPCNVVKGTTAVMNIEFVSAKDNTEQLYAQAIMKMMGISIPFELSGNTANVCDNLLDGKTCPIAKDEKAIYVMKLDIDAYFPETRTSVQISLVDKEIGPIACFAWDMNIIADKTMA
ncbi:NPC intracellular cholesterol transporter 2-like [Musca autumnalis]|uniref:NPC intracellular cholesterol transporter 2-like n=1 Tax=Musca autumnalis TaxID=221902 RepID=UPI003CF78AD9